MWSTAMGEGKTLLRCVQRSVLLSWLLPAPVDACQKRMSKDLLLDRLFTSRRLSKEIWSIKFMQTGIWFDEIFLHARLPALKKIQEVHIHTCTHERCTH